MTGVRKKVLHHRVVKQWNRLSREVVIAPNSLEFREHLGSVLRRQVWVLGGPVRGQELV